MDKKEAASLRTQILVQRKIQLSSDDSRMKVWLQQNQPGCDRCNTANTDNSTEKWGRTGLQSSSVTRRKNLQGPSVFTLTRYSSYAEILAWAAFCCYAIWPDLKNPSLYSAIHCGLKSVNHRWKISSLFNTIQLCQAHLKYENRHCKTNISESNLERSYLHCCQEDACIFKSLVIFVA